MEIYINTVYGKNKFEILNSWKVKDLKEAASKSYGISKEEQIMVFNDKEMKDNELLSSLGIKSESLIELIFDFNEFRVTVVYESKTLDFDVKKSETVLDFKRKICKIARKSVEEIILICKGTEMTDDKLLGDFDISGKSIINVITKLVKEQRKLLVRLDNGQSLQVDYGNKIKGLDVRKKINDDLGGESECIGLSMRGKGIKDDEYIGDDTSNSAFMSLQATCTLNASKFDIKLIVKEPSNSSISVQISKKAKCIVLKQKMAALSGMPITEQCMTFNGVILEDDKLLEEYQIANNSVILLVAKLRGG